MEKNYLEFSRADDCPTLATKFFYRFFEILPGLVSSLTFFLAVFFSFYLPAVAAIFIILFDFYWFLKVLYLSFHQVSSLSKMKKNLKIDWLKKLEEFEGWQKIYHLVFLPFYKEGEKTVENSLSTLLATLYPKEKMIVVLAVEERGGEKAKAVAKKMEEKFAKNFFRFFVVFHPQNLPGEIAGKGANVNYALLKIKPELEKIGIETENLVVTIFDADTRPYPHYFSCLTYHYLKLGKPERVAFQPLPLYNNNVWQVPFFSRIVATSNTFWQMVQQERPEQLVTFSSHSLPYSVLEKIGYPKNVVSDDSRIFWKAFLYYDGDFQTIPLFYPVSLDALLGQNLLKTIVNQYKQQRRWAWGVENIPYLFFGFWKNKKIPLSLKLRHAFIIFEGFWSWATASILIFFLGWLPILVGGGKFRVSVLSFNLPVITRDIMMWAMIGVLVCAVSSLLILPPRPKEIPGRKNVFLFFQWLFLPITLIAFGCLPAFESQLRLMLNKRLGFWTTEKV
jgi:cellulose synthase/poly-beta-1,6-N-acetylglucosamine synthase-like glycosyltransferase